MVFNNYLNNIKKYDKLEKETTGETVVSLLGDRDGTIFYSTKKLDYSDTVIDIYFRSSTDRIARYLCSKKIEYYKSLEGFINKKVTFIQQNVSC